MGVRDLVRVLSAGPASERSGLSLAQYQQMTSQLNYGGNLYQVLGNQSYGKSEPPVALTGNTAYSSNGVAFAVERRRIELFRQTSFAFKRDGSGPKPMAADLLPLDIPGLENPGKMLAWMLLDADLAGNSYQVLHRDRLRRLNPQWCTIVSGSELDPDNPDVAWDAEPIGLIYQPPHKPGSVETFLWDEVAHFPPIEDPNARWRGMSWMSPVFAEVENTNAYNMYISKFWQNNATPNMAVVFPPEVLKETVEAFRDVFMQKHTGVTQAFRTAFLGGGADLKMIGTNLKDLTAKEITSDHFAKICAAGGVPPIVVTIVPGLESASTYANYASAHRAFADLTMRPLWLGAVSALSKLFPAPAGSELWYDVSDVSALQADALDDAEVMNKQAMTMRTLVDGGYEPSTVTEAVSTGDMTKLVHSGNLSVQLIPAGQLPAGGK